MELLQISTITSLSFGVASGHLTDLTPLPRLLVPSFFTDLKRAVSSTILYLPLKASRRLLGELIRYLLTSYVRILFRRTPTPLLMSFRISDIISLESVTNKNGWSGLLSAPKPERSPLFNRDVICNDTRVDCVTFSFLT